MLAFAFPVIFLPSILSLVCPCQVVLELPVWVISGWMCCTCQTQVYFWVFVPERFLELQFEKDVLLPPPAMLLQVPPA